MTHSAKEVMLLSSNSSAMRSIFSANSVARWNRPDHEQASDIALNEYV